MISKRIKEALQVKKEKIDNGIIVNKDGSETRPLNGIIRLGNPRGFGDFQKLGVEKINFNSLNNKENIQAMNIICGARIKGMTFQQIADNLNRLHCTTRNGKIFNPIQVRRLNKRCREFTDD